jgi:hypothetical protein
MKTERTGQLEENSEREAFIPGDKTKLESEI